MLAFILLNKMKEIDIYNIVIESKSLNITYRKNFSAESFDDCFRKMKMYIEKIKTRQFASDYQIVELRWTGTIIV